MFGVQVWDLSKSFGPARVLEDVSFRVEPGELVALLGPSGSGKSTLLRAIAGLDTPDTGTITIKGKDITVQGSGKIGIKASSDVVIKGSKIAQN